MFRLRGEYLAPWTARSYLLDLICQTGFIEIPVGAISLQDFVQMSPDQKQHLTRLMSYFRRVDDHPPATVPQFLRRVLGTCAARANPLLLAMWLCFASDCAVSQDSIDAGVQAWRRVAGLYKKLYNIHPLAAVVAKLVSA